MARSGYCKIIGTKSGEVKGGVKQHGHEDTLEVLAISHKVEVPRDAHTGQASGRRRHNPFVIVKALDKSSPLLFKMMCENEELKSVEIKINRVNPKGGEELFFTYKLEGANIVDIETDMKSVKDKNFDYLPHMEHVSFSYSKITWTIEEGGIMASDDWMDRMAS
jgi:type VI secretion system secreted protein Hcp